MPKGAYAFGCLAVVAVLSLLAYLLHVPTVWIGGMLLVLLAAAALTGLLNGRP